MKIENEQLAICQQFGVRPMPPSRIDKMGIARKVREGIRPINGLRHPPFRGTSGWYIWAGEVLGTSDDFFVPIHSYHMSEWCPMAVKYLCLPSGWRFLVTETYEDVWFDPSLLTTK